MSKRKQLLLRSYGPAPTPTTLAVDSTKELAGDGGKDEDAINANAVVGNETSAEVRDPFKMALIHMHMSLKDGMSSPLGYPFTACLYQSDLVDGSDVSGRISSKNCFEMINVVASSTSDSNIPTGIVSCFNSAAGGVECPYAFVHIGSAGCAYHRGNLLNCKITHMLCLCESTKFIFGDDKEEDCEGKKIAFLKVKINDSPDANLSEIFDTCFNFIDSCRSKNGKILVHCFQGKSRSAAICCAYLVSRFRLSVDESIEILKRARPVVEPNPGFMRQLRDFEKKLHSSGS